MHRVTALPKIVKLHKYISIFPWKKDGNTVATTLKLHEFYTIIH